MMTRAPHSPLAFDDTGGDGPLLVMLPGAGDLRTEYRFNIAPLAAAGYRVVTADLPGHGDSGPAAEYTVAAAAASLIDLIEHLDSGPAVVVATSFAPAAAVWAAAERPDLVRALVAISPHLYADNSLKGRMLSAAIRMLLAGPWAGSMWARFYAGWYKSTPPADLDREIERLRGMLADPSRRRAVRRTLTAGRRGVAEKVSQLTIPTLTIFGSADDHFADPTAEAAAVAADLRGASLVVEGAGHYPQVEAPDQVTAAITAFLATIR
jgi:pimeloyl-ACP methyl ester carboxylesterase